MKVKATFHKNIDGLTLIPTIFVDKWGNARNKNDSH